MSGSHPPTATRAGRTEMGKGSTARKKGYNPHMAQTILIIEDEVELVRVLRDYLERAGYRVEAAYDGPKGISAFEHLKPDLVLLDLNLPGVDGLEVARSIRRRSDAPIIMLTARVEEADRVVGLELGADDYVTKPFSPREVVARIRAVLRRVHGEPMQDEIIRAADVVIDMQRHSVVVAGKQINLTPMEFKILAAMARQPGRAFSRLQLLEATQGDAYEGYERTIDVHIKNLRTKIEPQSAQHRYVQTVFGVGYRFVEEE
jgi:DNA-binding response OmpR family regulator